MAFIGEKIELVPFSVSAKESFLDYAMSVIKSRALPDVRDGLKPVHRRILYSMYELGFTHDSPYKKSARSVGDVIGKYHPHGDSAVYDTMVRMSQWFKYLHTLIDMHGNNGSIDGDAPAAMRYTESRLTKIASEMLRGLKDGQIHTQLVDYQDNYDGEEKEPVVLPSRFPNFLVNGTYGIAVGMTSDVPPHNLIEVIDAVIAQIRNPHITIEELMEFIKGPDFPTGGIVMGTDGIKKGYLTGEGSFKLRGKAEIIENKDGSFKIEITEIPYFVNRKKLENEIWDMQLEYEKYKTDEERPDKAENFIVPDGIETDFKNGLRMTIHLRKSVESPELVLNKIYKYTSMERSFQIKNVALVPSKKADGTIGTTPEVLNLKSIITEYIKHQLEVVTRRYQYDLAKLEKQLHTLSAFIKAFNRLDETIATIRTSKSRQEAIENLCTLLEIDEAQAKEILEKRIQTLANFEQDSLKEDYQNKLNSASIIREKLANEQLIFEDIILDLNEMKEVYGRNRLTEISEELGDIDDLSLIPNDPMVITITNNGFMKRTEESSYRTQRRKGMGVNSQDMWEGDFISHLQVTNNHDTLLFFTNEGRVYKKEVYRIPLRSKTSKGMNIAHFLNMQKGEKIQSIMSISEFADNQYLFFATKNGMVKKTKLSEYQNIRSNGIFAIALKEGDEVINTMLTNGSRNVTLLTKQGKSITFSGDEVRPLSRKTQGIRGIRLAKNDEVVSSIVHEEEGELLIVTSLGYGKRTPLSDYRVQHCGGKGILTAKLTDKTGVVVSSSAVQNEDTMMLMTQGAISIKVYVKEMAQSSRNTQGTKIINLREGDQVNQIARILEEEEEE